MNTGEFNQLEFNQETIEVAPPVGAIINQFQGANLGADLYNGAIIV